MIQNLSMSKLKPCPFCGGQAGIAEWVVGCVDCQVLFIFTPGDKKEMKDNIDKWNKRNGG